MKILFVSDLFSESVSQVIEKLVQRVVKYRGTETSPMCTYSCILTFHGTIVSEILLNAVCDSGHPLLEGHAPMLALQQLSCHVVRLQASETDETLLRQHPNHRDRIGRRIRQPSLDDSSQINQGQQKLFEQSGRETSHGSTFSTTVSHVCPSPHSDLLFTCSGRSPSKLSSAQYYAQGLVAFVSSEPCLMCSMALLHSRSGRMMVCPVSN